VHIKFLEHGKGSAAKASAYVLDKLDHMGNVRAGVEVLRGMQLRLTRFVTPAAPVEIHKRSHRLVKRRCPNRRADQRSLNDFEQHAFAGLEQSQYHLFAVLHTDQDGSKHIHVLTPRLDIEAENH
jgi:hypothetical protein